MAESAESGFVGLLLSLIVIIIGVVAGIWLTYDVLGFAPKNSAG